MGFYPVSVGLQKDAKHKNIHLKQNSTQSYTNNKRHITDVNTTQNCKGIPVTGRGGL
jgi:hypothetical protein